MSRLVPCTAQTPAASPQLPIRRREGVPIQLVHKDILCRRQPSRRREDGDLHAPSKHRPRKASSRSEVTANSSMATLLGNRPRSSWYSPHDATMPTSRRELHQSPRSSADIAMLVPHGDRAWRQLIAEWRRGRIRHRHSVVQWRCGQFSSPLARQSDSPVSPITAVVFQDLSGNGVVQLVGAEPVDSVLIRRGTHRDLPRYEPARMVLGHADVRIVGFGFRRGDQVQRGVQAGGLVRAPQQFPADALTLMRRVDRQVG